MMRKRKNWSLNKAPFIFVKIRIKNTFVIETKPTKLTKEELYYEER